MLSYNQTIGFSVGLSIIANAAVIGIGFAIKCGLQAIRQKVGDKKYNKLVIHGRKVVADLKALEEDSGMKRPIELFVVAAEKKLMESTGVDQSKANEIISKVISSVDSMVDDSVKMPDEQKDEAAEVVQPIQPTQVTGSAQQEQQSAQNIISNIANIPNQTQGVS